MQDNKKKTGRLEEINVILTPIIPFVKGVKIGD